MHIWHFLGNFVILYQTLLLKVAVGTDCFPVIRNLPLNGPTFTNIIYKHKNNIFQQVLSSIPTLE